MDVLWKVGNKTDDAFDTARKFADLGYKVRRLFLHSSSQHECNSSSFRTLGYPVWISL